MRDDLSRVRLPHGAPRRRLHRCGKETTPLTSRAAEIDLPVYLVAWTREARGRAVLANEWLARLEAATKEVVVFERSGHRPSLEEPGRFAELTRRVFEETMPSR